MINLNPKRFVVYVLFCLHLLIPISTGEKVTFLHLYSQIYPKVVQMHGLDKIIKCSELMETSRNKC